MSSHPEHPSRRAAFAAAGVASAGLALGLAACDRLKGGGGEEDVSAVEDLMREHGVLRRLLVIYRETAGLLRGGARLDLQALAQAADLFRQFGEDYHEKKLEEAHIFPAVRKAGGPAAGLIDTLLLQHDRGRQVNAYIGQRAAAGVGGDPEPLARALESFARMYEAHAAFEDTIVFQAWRKALPKGELEKWGDRFEDIERDTFKGDGFDMAADRAADIERRLGLADLARYTVAPPPPAEAGTGRAAAD